MATERTDFVNTLSICVSLILIFVANQEVIGRAHHKVHNLALYPERHSWCQATPIRQEIAHAPECQPKIIDNMVCLGACFSYSVPRAQDYQPIDPYCDKCDKTFSSWTVITLNCTHESNGEPYTLTRNVELITNCSCVDCNDNARRENDEDPNEPEEEDLPDALEGHEELLGIHKGVIHSLKSVSAELRDEDTMINENKIPSDDDDDAEALARLERHRASLVHHHHHHRHQVEANHDL